MNTPFLEKQLSIMDLLEPMQDVEKKRIVMTRAYGKETELSIPEIEHDPVEVEIRGVPALVSFGYMVDTRAILPMGSLFWSDTGFLSMVHPIDRITQDDNIDEVVAYTILEVERYIDMPKSSDGNGGLDGKLVRWWPMYVHQWAQNRAFALKIDRSKRWNKWGPEEHERLWRSHDADQARKLRKMINEGIDPDELGALGHYKGKWPKVTKEEMARAMEDAK